MNRTSLSLSVACAFVILSGATEAFAGGSELPENTALSVARGGTGVASKRDPSALYFNPALLPRAEGFQVLLDVNLVNLNADFQRNPLQTDRADEPQQFSRASNDAGFFPAPFLALSYDFGIENFAAGIGVFGPSAYGERCFSRLQNGECEADFSSSARHMVLGSELLQIYFTAGAGYTFDLLGGELSIGAAAALAYQNLDFKLILDEVLVDGTYDEAQGNQAPFTVSSLTDIKPTGFLGAAYDYEGFRVAASYRPPISWTSEGTFEIELPESISGFSELQGNELEFKNEQAGSLRAGIHYEFGSHPGVASHPLFDIEFNFVWEDWSRLDFFIIDPDAQVLIGGVEQNLNPVYQPKLWRDTYSFRLGSSYGPLEWLTVHLGASYETAAQDDSATNVDFFSWERLGVGGGASIHLWRHLDFTLAYAHTFMGTRSVEDGEVYPAVPFSGCTGPDFDSEACATPGTPPGNPQNEGEWSASFQILSIGTTFKF